ncbi:MAG: OmpA family protein [Gammaproteobacteria bacterium]|nr:OmpA family protein [Gammaproteobacteria bacterium]
MHVSHSGRRNGLQFLSVSVLGLCLLIAGLSSQAHNYRARLDIAEWHLETSRLECRLWQNIPVYGDAIFRYKAGELQTFFLQSKRIVSPVGDAQIKVIAPDWLPGIAAHDVGAVSTQRGRVPVTVGAEMSAELLAELQEGMFPTIIHNGWFPEHEVKVDISSVNFKQAYQAYVLCLSDLLPVNYDQISRSTVLFDTDHWKLSVAMKGHLEMVAEYVNVDLSVDKIYVDGHTDDRGRKGYNWELSRKRGLAVQDYLIKQGVDPNRVVMRYHGKRYPINTNGNIRERSRNRRVTLRLLRS